MNRLRLGARDAHMIESLLLIFVYVRSSFVSWNVSADYAIGIFSLLQSVHTERVRTLASIRMCRMKRSSDKIITTTLWVILQYSFWPPFNRTCGLTPDGNNNNRNIEKHDKWKWVFSIIELRVCLSFESFQFSMVAQYLIVRLALPKH